MSYAGVEGPEPVHGHQHCGNNKPHEIHIWGKVWGYDTAKICTGQLKPPLCEHDRDERYDGLS